jgi:histone H3/H4
MMEYHKSPTELPKELPSLDVFRGLQALIQLVEFQMAAIDDLTTAVNAAIAEIQSLASQLAAAKAAGAGAATDTQLEGLASQLNAAVTAATPAQPAPTETAPAAAPATPAGS